MDTASSGTEELIRFIGSGKGHGLTDEFIVSLLRKNGWPEKRVYLAFSSYYAGVLGSPVPTKIAQSENARDAFYYLLNFLTLGFWAVALGQIFYTLIAHWLPDPAKISPYYNASLRDEVSWQVATVLITFPLFLFIHRLISRQLMERPDLYDSGVRKWLTYVALVIASTILLADGIWFLQALVKGDLTVRFILDTLVLLLLGGGVFTYYLSTIDAPHNQR